MSTKCLLSTQMPVTMLSAGLLHTMNMSSFASPKSSPQLNRNMPWWIKNFLWLMKHSSIITTSFMDAKSSWEWFSRIYVIMTQNTQTSKSSISTSQSIKDSKPNSNTMRERLRLEPRDYQDSLPMKVPSKIPSMNSMILSSLTQHSMNSFVLMYITLPNYKLMMMSSKPSNSSQQNRFSHAQRVITHNIQQMNLGTKRCVQSSHPMV